MNKCIVQFFFRLTKEKIHPAKKKELEAEHTRQKTHAKCIARCRYCKLYMSPFSVLSQLQRSVAYYTLIHNDDGKCVLGGDTSSNFLDFKVCTNANLCVCQKYKCGIV